MSLDKMMNYFSAANTMEFLLALLLFIVLVVLIRMSCNDSDDFSLRSLVSVEGKLDEKKFTRFGAWVLSSWGFVYLLVSKPENFPEWYFTVYMGAWVINVIADKYFNGVPKVTTPPNPHQNYPARRPDPINSKYDEPPKY